MPGWLTRLVIRYQNTKKMGKQFEEGFIAAGLHRRPEKDVLAFFTELYGVPNPPRKEHSFFPAWWLLVWCETGLLPEVPPLMGAVFDKRTMVLTKRHEFAAGFVEAVAAGLDPAYARAYREAFKEVDIRVITGYWVRGIPIDYLLSSAH